MRDLLDRLLPSRLTIVLAVICLIAVPAAVTASYHWGVRNRDAVREQKRADGLHAEIYAEKTGYRDRLAQCQASEGVLRLDIEDQNAAIQRWRSEAAANKAAAERAVAQHRQELRALERQVRTPEAQARPGESQCEAADRLILERFP